MTAPDTTTVTERDRSHDGPPYKITIDDKHYEVGHRFRTGLQLKELAGIPAANHLFLEVPGPGEDEQIRDDFAVPMQYGLHFYDVPVGNLGGR
jgi:hypothetical protein